jgi:NADH:ubiquinone reductase (H+-translocating)
MNQRPRVVIIGAGFGGLYTARMLERENVDVLLIDRHNFHTFTPLLYQVATSGLEPEEIGYPVRGIFRAESNIRFLMGEVTGINRDQKFVEVVYDDQTRQERYDFLVVAAGSVTNYFNMPDVAQHSFELKALHDAVSLRNHTLRLFETAAWVTDEVQRQALTTLVVVGGGPTGLELAGALLELYKNVLSKEYPFLHEMTPNVILVEATDTLLIPFPQRLQKSALRQLQSLGVQVILGNPVAETADNHTRLKDGRVIPTHTLIWAAGVRANPIGELLKLPLNRGGCVPVKPTMQAVGDEGVYVVGDMAYLEDDKGQPYPMLIPVAKQQGILAAKNILRRIAGEEEKTFRYVDRGIMATIGRSRAVAWIYNRIQLNGYLAWLSWLGLHLIALMGFRNRLNVFVNWVWNYITYDRSVRLILDSPPREQTESGEPKSTEQANALPEVESHT